MATSLPAAELRGLALAQAKNTFGRGDKRNGVSATEVKSMVGVSDTLGDLIGRSEENILHQMREEGGREALNRSQRQVLWPLHDIAITSIACCIAYQREVGGGGGGGGGYIAQ